jgi:hypothetical protein
MLVVIWVLGLFIFFEVNKLIGLAIGKYESGS